MNESSRNTRTLIVSFVLAIMVLIPLRFVEVGQSVVFDNPQVLGEQTVIMPEATEAVPVLEAPYNEIDEVKNTSCISKANAETILSQDKSRIEKGGLNGSEIDQIVAEMLEVEKNTCK